MAFSNIFLQLDDSEYHENIVKLLTVLCKIGTAFINAEKRKIL
jgi:hypothetical protein